MKYDLTLWLYVQRAWSDHTFGAHERTEGIVKHIEKEIKELKRDPADLSEYIDIAVLAFDAALNRGWSPEDIATAFFNKQKVNIFERTWNPQNDGSEPVEHVRDKENIVDEVTSEEYKDPTVGRFAAHRGKL